LFKPKPYTDPVSVSSQVEYEPQNARITFEFRPLFRGT